MARYRLKYCLKGPLNPKQPTNQLINPNKVSSGPPFIVSYLFCGTHFSVSLSLCSVRSVLLLLPGKVSAGSLKYGVWSGGAMVMGKLPVLGRPTSWITVGQGPTALAVGAGGGYLDIFTLIYPFFPLSPSL